MISHTAFIFNCIWQAYSLNLSVMAEPRQLVLLGDFGYTVVVFNPTKPLGSGAYGAVFKARCDELPCAAKLLHPNFFYLQ